LPMLAPAMANAGGASGEWSKKKQASGYPRSLHNR
jgi:hypothetical protein